MEEAWCGEVGEMFVGVPDREGSGEKWWVPCEFGGVL